MPKWINVEDSLPPDDHMVLIVDDVSCMYVGWLINGYWHSSDCCECLIQNVLFWSELPDFPCVDDCDKERLDRNASSIVEKLIAKLKDE